MALRHPSLARIAQPSEVGYLPGHHAPHAQRVLAHMPNGDADPFRGLSQGEPLLAAEPVGLPGLGRYLQPDVRLGDLEEFEVELLAQAGFQVAMGRLRGQQLPGELRTLFLASVPIVAPVPNAILDDPVQPAPEAGLGAVESL